MGYYSGNGVVTGGGQDTSVFFHFAYGGAHNVWQKRVSSVVKKAGVDLSTAQSAACSNNLTTKNLFNNAQTVHCWAPNVSGTKVDVSYSQISDSNLYELTIATNTYQGKLDDGSWQ